MQNKDYNICLLKKAIYNDNISATKLKRHFQFQGDPRDNKNILDN